LSVSDAQTEEPEQVSSPGKEEKTREPVSGESDDYQRVPLEEIIGHYGIAGVHPAAELLPMMSDEEFQIMCVDVAQKDFLRPVLIGRDKMLIDGRNRLQVEWALELDPSIEEVSLEDVLGYVLSENVVRRHLTVGQRAMIGEKIANLPKGVRSDSRMWLSEPITQEQAAKQLNTSITAIKQARVVRGWAKEEVEAVEAGTESLEQAYKRAQKKREKTEGQKKSAKRKSQPRRKDDFVELQAPLDSSQDVPQEPVEVESQATRQDCVKALFTFVEVLANSTDEPFDAALLTSQELDIAKCRGVWPKLMALMRTMRDLITAP
jgi:hypothetical protein